jgi:hypothetical protein
LCSRSFGPEPRRDGTLITRLSTTLNSRPMLRCVAGGEADEAEPCGSRIPLRQNPAVMNRGAYMERLPPRCTDVRIWHLQGMKLNHANCYLRAIARIPKAGATERVHSGSGAPLARGGMTGSGKGGTAPHGRENGMASGPASGGVSDQGVAWGRGRIFVGPDHSTSVPMRLPGQDASAEIMCAVFYCQRTESNSERRRTDASVACSAARA